MSLDSLTTIKYTYKQYNIKSYQISFSPGWWNDWRPMKVANFLHIRQMDELWVIHYSVVFHSLPTEWFGVKSCASDSFCEARPLSNPMAFPLHSFLRGSLVWASTARTLMPLFSSDPHLSSSSRISLFVHAICENIVRLSFPWPWRLLGAIR